ncbi:hypothetical protein KIN20_013017 [Parelaphostrongylus tenuis]|uniref:Uncharacterized protein n=1 Tax=Parelaphostrongylus tenuis TaxID=148309 RepID=A0AAD5MG00_PARTN|nr:hypothetical protein KIN20_013017 [Parelaphostrongylus tenuis]
MSPISACRNVEQTLVAEEVRATFLLQIATPDAQNRPPNDLSVLFIRMYNRLLVSKTYPAPYALHEVACTEAQLTQTLSPQLRHITQIAFWTDTRLMFGNSEAAIIELIGQWRVEERWNAAEELLAAVVAILVLLKAFARIQ